MNTRVAWLLSLAALGGCKCGDQPSPVVVDAAPATSAASSSAVAAPGSSGSALALSLPFSASRGPDGDVYVAGLVAARGVLGLERRDAHGAVVWSVDALADVAWTPDAEARVLASASGLAVSWRGMQGKALVRLLVAFDKSGKRLGDPQPIGPGSCATDDGVAWSELVDGGASEVVRRPFSWEPKATLGTVTRDLEPLLACGSHRVFALEEGDEEVGLSSFPREKDQKGPAPLIAASPSDGDDERQHEEFTVGDDLGVVRATTKGKLLLREATPGLGAWRPFPRELAEDDDIVAVDGDASYAYVVITRDAIARCEAGATATDVRLVRAKRGAGKPEADRQDDALLAAEPCGVDVGAFWTGTIGARFVVAWTELAPHAANAPPMAGFAYRVVGEEVKRVAQPADGFSFAGCDDKSCSVVALTRTDADAMAPGLARVLTFP